MLPPTRNFTGNHSNAHPPMRNFIGNHSNAHPPTRNLIGNHSNAHPPTRNFIGNHSNADPKKYWREHKNEDQMFCNVSRDIHTGVLQNVDDTCNINLIARFHGRFCSTDNNYTWQYIYYGVEGIWSTWAAALFISILVLEI